MKILMTICSVAQKDRLSALGQSERGLRIVRMNAYLKDNLGYNRSWAISGQSSGTNAGA